MSNYVLMTKPRDPVMVLHTINPYVNDSNINDCIFKEGSNQVSELTTLAYMVHGFKDVNRDFNKLKGAYLYGAEIINSQINK